MTTPHLSASNAINEFESIRYMSPFRGQLLSEQMDTYAAYALDILEKQTGFDATLEEMLEALEQNKETRIRCARIILDRETFIVFRDLSMISYRNSPEEDVETDVRSTHPSGRLLDHCEDDMEQGLLPLALTLDLGFHPMEATGIILKPMVDHNCDGLESIKLVCREGGSECELISPIYFEDVSQGLRSIFNRAEELIEHSRADAPYLPRIARPEPSDIAQVDIYEFESSSLWMRDDTPYYWPSYLSRPISAAEDVSEIEEHVSKLVELMLWACPEDFPDGISLSVLSSITTEDLPLIRCDVIEDLPKGRAKRAIVEQALALLQSEFAEVYRLAGWEFPVGHRTGAPTANAAGAIGLPVTTINVSRPDAWRALKLEGEIPHPFAKLPGYVDPEEVVEHLDALRAAPHPLASDLAEQEGEAFIMKRKSKRPERDAVDEYSITVAGGPQASLLERLVARVASGKGMDHYQRMPDTDGEEFTYTLIVAEAHDAHFRNPIGFTTISGHLHSDVDQIGGVIGSYPVTTYSLSVCLDRVELAKAMGADLREVLMDAIEFSIRHLIYRMLQQGEEQMKHFEIDLTLSSRLHEDEQPSVGDDLLANLFASMTQLRESLTKLEAIPHVSIRDIVQYDDHLLAA